MSSAKRLKKGERDLEIVCNLQWKSKYGYDKDRSNIVGMYDVPSTTLDWDTFKAYLLKNSGNSSADIKVSFIDSNEKEIPIESQIDFQLALYSFRKRARNGEIITLKLEKIADHKKSTCIKANEADCLDNFTIPPSWFLKYMKKFKKEMIDEMTSTLTTTLSKNSHQNTSHHRKSKVDMYKRSKKYSERIPIRISRSTEKDLRDIGVIIQNQMREKDHHHIKTKTKPLKLSSDSDPGHYPMNSQFIGISMDNDDVVMNATAVNSYQTVTLRMLGGERYLHKWKVVNTGTQPWTKNTELRFAWGSELLKPAEKKVSCPQLQPGEKGDVFVSLNVPETPGKYESYWHFYHFGRRFGHWLGCQVIVDEFSLRKSYTPPGLPKNIVSAEQECKETSPTAPKISEVEPHEILPTPIDLMDESNYSFPNVFSYLNDNMQKLNINPDHLTELKENNEVQISSDSDNLSIISMSGGNSVSSDIFEFISNDKNEEIKENKEQVENATSCSNEFENLSIKVENCNDNELKILDKANVNLALHLIKNENESEKPCESNQENAASFSESDYPEYAYIYYNGEKYAFHKKYLNEEYFKTAEKSKEMKVDEISLEASERQRNNSQNSENRLFVFPRHSPGFEVVYPTENGEAETFTTMGVCGGSIPDTFTSLDSSYSQYESNLHQQSESFTSLESENSKCKNPSTERCEERVLDPSNSNNTESNQLDVKSCSPVHCDCSCASTSNTNPEINQDVKSDDGSSNSNRKEKSNMNCPKPHFNSTQDNLLTGAAILASSAMSTARNMMSIVMQNGEGHWVNGHWISEGTNSKRENGLKLLAEMGFLNRDLNATLLARYNDNIQLVISELV